MIAVETNSNQFDSCCEIRKFISIIRRRFASISLKMSDSDFELTPPEIKQIAESAAQELLPQKSKARYEAQYNSFKTWCEMKNIKVYSESVLLAYFTQLVDKKIKSLWAIYSMLRACIALNDNLDISKYAKLIAFLKRKSSLHKPKKSQILEEEHISGFLNEAADENFLLMKVALIIGLSGACRREELYNMVINDIQVKDDVLLIEIPKSKTNVSRSFVVSKPEWVNTVKKYIDIRKKVDKIKDRLFLRYEKGKCFASPVGINTIGLIPSKIAEFLHLENPKDYSGHCFRRSSATLLVNKGGDLLALKRHGKWKSSTVAESYVEESLKRKLEVAEMMAGQPSTSKKPNLSTSTAQLDLTSCESHTTESTTVTSNEILPSFSNLSNCEIKITIYKNCTITKEND